jgi:hypothetical protein
MNAQIVDSPLGRIYDTTSMNAAELASLIAEVNPSNYLSKLHTNADSTPTRWRSNGAIKLFKRDPMRIRIPIKHGLYDYDRIESVDDFNRFLVIPAR